MSYQIVGKTPINNLLDLDSYDSGSSSNRYPEKTEERQVPNLQKYLRGDVKSQHMNGMNGGNDYSSRNNNVSFIDENFEISPSHMAPGNHQPFMSPGPMPMGPPGSSFSQPISVENFADPAPAAPATLNCPQVFDHIHNCPICSKFYNSDRTIYIVTIVLLSLVCIILLKRVLEK